MRCPICETDLADALEGETQKPFCSKRCRLLDLSKWLGGEYRIAGRPLDDLGPPHPEGAALDDDGN